MSVIRILDDIVISKIAAGEVVERPASALKEFLENSIDAGASKIFVELDSGGKRLVKVSDNGCGMSREDAVLCVERHATSKIENESELVSVSTLGFRGEALPSIAAVSRFSLTTRSPDEDTGTEILIEGGKVKSVKDAGCPAGTTVEARSLFFNARPRLKFLKANATELSRSLAAVRCAAVANPDVAFEVSHNGRNILRFNAGNVEDRVRDVVGKVALYEISPPGGEQSVEVAGFLCSPSDGFSSMSRLYCHVNGRYVRDRFINRTVMDNFGRVFDRGRYPQGAIFLTLAPEDVDVNVHPTKHEVRFKSPGAVAVAISSAVEGLLSSAPWITGATYEDAGAQGGRSFAREESGNQYSPPRTAAGTAALPEREYAADTGKNSAFAFESSSASGPEREFPGTETTETDGFFSQLKVVGQACGLYIVCESSDGLLLIDQHAAHERVNFERFCAIYSGEGKLRAQRLLIPEIIEMRPEETALFGRFSGKMKSIGLSAEMFGENAVRLESLPASVQCSNSRDLFVDILARLAETDCPESAGALDEETKNVIAAMACHKSIRSGYVMADAEIKSLLSEMDRCESPHFCPHGRPVAVSLRYGRLEKMFKRK